MSKTFLLAGNGLFRNRGCEAITQGTVAVLTKVFGPSTKVVHAGSGYPGNTGAEEVLFCPEMKEYSLPWIEYQLNRYCGTALPGAFPHLQRHIAKADAVLCIGGDNYSLDYGYPERFIQFDRLVRKLGKPLIYFGVSVGPFSADPKYELKMRKHLQQIDAICARETETVRYLSSIDVIENVHLVGDPAFAMSPQKPEAKRFELAQNNFIGVNFSSTVGRMLVDNHLPDNNLSIIGNNIDSHSHEHIISRYAEITASLMNINNGNLIFIPHVTGGEHCDHAFMSKVADKLAEMGYDRPAIAPDNLSAAEYKWIISQAKVFIGARTHSTIAAFSSGVPTISLAYSIKAQGLTRDMYGFDDFCVDGKDASPERISHLTGLLLKDERSYRDSLSQQAEKMKSKAFLAGEIIKSRVLN